MSQQLTDFLTSLATDEALVKEFNNDAESTMRANKVSEEHIKLVIDKDYKAIQAILGADYSIATNHIIKAFRN